HSLPLHDALPIYDRTPSHESPRSQRAAVGVVAGGAGGPTAVAAAAAGARTAHHGRAPTPGPSDARRSDRCNNLSPVELGTRPRGTGWRPRRGALARLASFPPGLRRQTEEGAAASAELRQESLRLRRQAVLHVTVSRKLKGSPQLQKAGP